MGSKKEPHIIVFGNEKGGTGKSTAAMHTIVGLLRLGYKVGSLDLDSHQATLTGYLQNREAHAEELPMPQHIHIRRIDNSRDTMQNRLAEQDSVTKAIGRLQDNDYIIIDTPGGDTYMSVVGHSFADTIVTPVNDSFVDLDLLGRFEGENLSKIVPSVYTEMVWNLRGQRTKRDGKFIDWVVMRNRLGHLYSHNKGEIGVVLDRMSRAFGFRLATGFGERVVFRELFVSGRTLLDLKADGPKSLSMSNISARQEVRYLIKSILPEKPAMTMALLKTA